MIELPPSTPKAVGEKGKVVAAYMARPVLVAAHEVGDVEVQATVSPGEAAEAGVLARASFDSAYALLVSGEEVLLCRYDTADREILGSERVRPAQSYRLTLTTEGDRVIGLVEPRGSARAVELEAFEEVPLGSGRVGVLLNPISPAAASATVADFRAASVERPKEVAPRAVYAIAGVAPDLRPRIRAMFDPPSPLRVTLSVRGSDGTPYETVAEPQGPLGTIDAVVGRELEAGATYEWSVTPEGRPDGVAGSLRAPAGPGAAVRFAFASCTSGRVTSYRSFRTALKRDPDFLLHGGDWGYADLTAVNTGPDQIQARWIRLLRHPDVMPLLQGTRLAFWQDDHDYNADNGWSDTIDAAAVEAFDQIHANPSDDYFDIRWGDVHVWCLDCRLHATDPDAPDGPDKSRIGAEQKAWLKEGMESSDAPVKIVASGMVFRNKVPEDPGWHNAYAHERDELLEFFSSLDATVAILSGDSHGQRLIHHFEFGELYEFNSSGTDFPGGGQGNNDPEHTLVNDDKSPGFALVELDEAGPNRKLKVSCLSSEDGSELFSKTFAVG